MEINWLAIARIAYEAYARQTGNKNYRGEEMPFFNQLPVVIQQAWVAAVTAACDAHARVATA